MAPKTFSILLKLEFVSIGDGNVGPGAVDVHGVGVSVFVKSLNPLLSGVICSFSWPFSFPQSLFKNKIFNLLKMGCVLPLFPINWMLEVDSIDY